MARRYAEKPLITATAVYSQLVREGHHPYEVDNAISRLFLAGEDERLFSSNEVDILRERLYRGREWCGMWGDEDDPEQSI